jgi:flagellar assembly protein FliH
MLCKGSLLRETDRVVPFDWCASQVDVASVPRAPLTETVDVAALERDAFAKGFAQGERAGKDVSAQRDNATMRRLAQTLDEMTALRATMLQRSERQVIALALAIAKRIVHSEMKADRDLMPAMVHVALERLGDTSAATVRLHPDDHATIASLRKADAHGLKVIADPSVGRGGCVVESEVGAVDLSVDAQISEFESNLLASDAA